MFNYTIGRDEAPISSENHIKTAYISSELTNLMNSDVKVKDVCIISNNTHFKSDFLIACRFKVSVILGDTEFGTSKMSEVEKSAINLAFCTLPVDVVNAKDRMRKAILRLSTAKFDEVDVIALATDKLSDSNHLRVVTSHITHVFKQHNNYISNLCSIKEIARKKGIKVRTVPYSVNLAEEAATKKGLHLAIGEMATGKTKFFVTPFFNQLCKDNKRPINLGSSRSLSRTYLKNEHDERFYEWAWSAGRHTEGLIGVCNTILLTETYSEYRELSEGLVCDEIEELFNHMSGNAIGEGTIEDKAKINNEFDSQFVKSDYILVTDAMMSVNTLERLLELNELREHKEIYIYDQKSSFEKPEVIVHKDEGSMLSLINETLKNKGKVAVFSDGKHNSTGSHLDKIKGAMNVNTLMIDGAFMSSDRAKEITNPNSLVEGYDMVIYNSAAKCGLSVTSDEFGKVFVFGHGTVTANELVQAMRRFRLAKEIHVFIKSYRKEQPENIEKIIARVAIDEIGDQLFTLEDAMKMASDKGTQSVAKRMLHKNRIQNVYANNVLSILRFIGFNVSFPSEIEISKESKVTDKSAINAEYSLRKARVIKAKKISTVEYDKLKLKSGNHIQSERDLIESYNLRRFYKVTDVSEELFDMDKCGSGRRFISNLNIAKGRKPIFETSSDAIKSAMYTKFFELTKLNTETIGSFSSVSVKDFIEFLNNGEISFGKGKKEKMKARAAFEVAFPESRISFAQPLSTVKSILKNELGVEDMSQGMTGCKNKRTREITARFDDVFIAFYKQSRDI